jgi:hypothetical protein
MGNSDTTKSQSPEKRDAKALQERSSEATSEKTVSDLEESEKISDSKSYNGSDETSIPSPDGTPNRERSGGRADGSDTGGPM